MVRKEDMRLLLLIKIEKQGPDTHSPPEATRKPDTLYEATIFKTLDIRQQRTVITERQETNKVSP